MKNNLSGNSVEYKNEIVENMFDFKPSFVAEKQGYTNQSFTGAFRIGSEQKTFLYYCVQSELYWSFSGRFGTKRLTKNYTRMGTSINHQLHQDWIQYQAAHPELRSSLRADNWG